MDLAKTKNQTNAIGEVKISITLTTNAYFLSGVRDFTMTFVKNMTGFGEQWAYRFQTVVDELASNAMEYGCREGDQIVITLMAHTDKSIEIMIEDPGHGSKKVTAEEMEKIYRNKLDLYGRGQYLGIRGRGLAQIVNAWSDKVTFENIDSGGIRVRVIKSFKENNSQSKI